MLCVRAFIIPEVFHIANAVHQINEEILDKEVRLIGDEGEQLGIMSAAVWRSSAGADIFFGAAA